MAAREEVVPKLAGAACRAVSAELRHGDDGATPCRSWQTSDAAEGDVGGGETCSESVTWVD